MSFAQTAGATEQGDDFIMGWDKLHKFFRVIAPPRKGGDSPDH
jgi:hypothetical protein